MYEHPDTPVFTSPHQRDGYCAICANGLASQYAHCAYCGARLPDTNALSEHLDEGCFDAMMTVVRARFL